MGWLTDRRGFLAAAAGLLMLGPPKLFKPPVGCSLKFELTQPDEQWVPHWTISKDGFTATIHGMSSQDLIDCHSLCATTELSSMIIEEIEFGVDGLRHLLGIHREYSYVAPKPIVDFWRNKLRRVELTRLDRAWILLFCHHLRGAHRCVNPKICAMLDNKLKELRHLPWAGPSKSKSLHAIC